MSSFPWSTTSWMPSHERPILGTRAPLVVLRRESRWDGRPRNEMLRTAPGRDGGAAAVLGAGRTSEVNADLDAPPTVPRPPRFDSGLARGIARAGRAAWPNQRVSAAPAARALSNSATAPWLHGVLPSRRARGSGGSRLLVRF